MKKCVVLTGAGISADSGLLTFRDAGGLWEGYKVTDVCTPEALAKNPQLVIDFYNQRRRQANAAEPNAAHKALLDLAEHYRVQIITQNVDNLHERAGSKNVLHLHGELNKLRSVADPDEIIEFNGEQTAETLSSSGGAMRPHIVFFGEQVPMFDVAVEEMRDADVVIIVGTSMQVYPAASLVHYAPQHADLYLVDPNPQSVAANIEVIPKRAAEGVPSLVAYLIEQAKAD
ncbi:NAD-dependent protein deacylase [Neisseria sp. N95_16]|uniref:NAD-dependent protein deacylase n=1 Tax=Neisseria brasiliensis TaxID=2666100 RepID=A0A5Q3S2E6_9NEIS|nr:MULTISPECIES: Sir2 family NAD-dependent protein deacetylase [Neisseria]MRN39366.1 NAD-dependent deacylase [Neisseria brasiliensis]PJO09923.1 NAD-dependent protein deacylase [Neisseria sp. N95_16]PJO77994.1 NAD-dependent protein deacylase [Neisseria sp. N177_16]QGL26119.1 NAD-dependent deacylase [Neisseria brasiliensis]